MLDEKTIARVMFIYIKDYYNNQNIRDNKLKKDSNMLRGIVMGLLTALNRVNQERMIEDLMGYALDVIREILVLNDEVKNNISI